VAEDPIPFIYQPLTQNYTPQATLHVRAGDGAAALAGAVRREVQAIDPTLAVFNVRTLEDQVFESLAPLRTNVIMLTTFGALALALASIGLYGGRADRCSADAEIGVRGAGAQPRLLRRFSVRPAARRCWRAAGLTASALMSIVPARCCRISVRSVTLANTAASLLSWWLCCQRHSPPRDANRSLSRYESNNH
jgi:hypothetical protein